MPETTQFGGLDASHVDGALQPNTILLARYRIMAMLGGGGQGAVYQARDLNFPDARRLVAVKEMLVTAPDPNLRQIALKTFQREANILATLSHPAIPKIYDFFDQNDRAYLVMEYINGNDLEAILNKTKKLPMEKIIEWAIDLCDVLFYLHSYQPEPIIFRDMKPANIMIDSLGKVRLIDFGIAKIFVQNEKQTQIGTEGYCAPEQYKGMANPLSDIFGMGSTLHQVITRTDPRLFPPFTFRERPLADYNDEAAPELQAIIDKATSTEPKDRFQSCAEMKAALEALRYQRPLNIAAARPRNGEPGSPSAPSSQPDSGGTSTSFITESTAGMQAKWIFRAEDELRGGPSYFNGMVFVGSYDTNMWAVNASDGSLVWKRATEGGIAATPVIDETMRIVLFGSEDRAFYALNTRDGSLVWSHLTDDKIRSSARLAHGYVFFGSDDGKLYAALVPNGRIMWEYATSAPIRSTPFVTNDRIILATDDGEIVSLELNGQRKWSYRAKRSITSSLVVDQEGYCYVGSYDNYVYALDSSNGFSHWRFRTNGPVIASPVVRNGFLYIGSTDGKMYCINTQTGKEKWSFDTGKPIVASPVSHQSAVYFGSTNNLFYCLDAQNGKQLWTFQTQGAITSAACLTQDTIYLTSMDRSLYALPLVNY